ncbi:hypothetical protein ACFL59_12295 [Planctomycetota bacterium]
MSREALTKEALSIEPERAAYRTRVAAPVLTAVGLTIGFVGPHHQSGWVALLVSTSLLIGFPAAGIAFSAIFQLTGARWGRAYRRLAEGSVALMPVGLGGLLLLMLGGGWYLPWAHDHHLTGGKDVWLTRGFWDTRLLLALALSYGISLLYLYYSLRRDFCLSEVGERFGGRLGTFLGRDISDREQERARCESKLSFLSPLVLVIFALSFSLLGFDLVMALEPDWFSTLFGAWYFMGHMFAGLALLAMVSVKLEGPMKLRRFFTETRRRDLATVLFAFCLLNIDFFWSQYFTIWYANMPEETLYVIARVHDTSLPWYRLSWLSLMAFFFLPFIALLFRRVKQSRLLLTVVAGVVVFGIFLARFIEVAPALLSFTEETSHVAVLQPLLAAVLTFLGMLGVGWGLYRWLLTEIPVLPIGDEVFVTEYGAEPEPHE